MHRCHHQFGGSDWLVWWRGREGCCHLWHWQLQHGTKDCKELVVVGIKIDGLEWSIVECAGAEQGCRSTRWEGWGCHCCGRSARLMVAIIGWSKREIGYGLGYDGLSTVPFRMRVFVVLGVRGLENQSLFFFRGRGIWNPYGKGQERVASGRGGRRGGEGGRGLIYSFST